MSNRGEWLEFSASGPKISTVKLFSFQRRRPRLTLPSPKGGGGFREGWGGLTTSGVPMTYTFKLSRRLARLRDASLVVAAVFTISCTGDESTGPGSGIVSDPNAISAAPGSALSPDSKKRWGRGRRTVVSFSVAPDTLTVAGGSTASFVATATLSDGSSADPSITWSASGGSIDANGKYTAGPVSGTYAVSAMTSSGVADTAAVIVTQSLPTIVDVSLSPTSVSLPVGGTRHFLAVGKSDNGSTVALGARYAATGGTISVEGLYQAGQTPGNFRVIATDTLTNLADTAAVIIEPPSPTLQAVVLTPASDTVTVGGTQQFTAVGKMTDGSTISVTVTWTASGGAITAGGLYTAGPTPGAFKVIATLQNGPQADTSNVTLTGSPAGTPPAAGGRYVSTTGNDASPGTQALPYKTIQRCLDVVQPGETCEVAAGTYPGTLTLKKSGTAGQPITVKCVSAKACTVTSGAARTLASSANVHFYTIDGFRFIATAVMTDGNLWFGNGAAWSKTDPTFGNNGYTLRNCYVEGEVKIYGHNNLIENCEFNGKNLWKNAVWERDPASHDNTYRNNLIYSYRERGIWSMQGTARALVEGNTVHDIGMWGINFDGAGTAVTFGKAINNHVYNIGLTQFGAGIFFEDGFDGLAQGNRIHTIGSGPGIFVQNYGFGSKVDAGWRASQEYRGLESRIRILNNVIHSYPTASGLRIVSANGITVDRNTFYNTTNRPNIITRSDQSDAGVVYVPKNIAITGNIFLTGGIDWQGGSPSTGSTVSGNFSGTPAPGFVNPTADLHLQPGSNACGAGAYPC